MVRFSFLKHPSSSGFRLIEVVFKLGRLASGMPTGKTESAIDLDAKLDMNWELALKRIYRQPPATVTTSPTKTEPIIDIESTTQA